MERIQNFPGCLLDPLIALIRGETILTRRFVDLSRMNKKFLERLLDRLDRGEVAARPRE